MTGRVVMCASVAGQVCTGWEGCFFAFRTAIGCNGVLQGGRACIGIASVHMPHCPPFSAADTCPALGTFWDRGVRRIFSLVRLCLRAPSGAFA